MKKFICLSLLLVLLGMSLPGPVVNAQDGATLALASAYYLRVDSGTFAAIDDRSYTLTLEDVGDDIIWLMVFPDLQVQELSLDNLAANWAAAGDDLTAEAVLEIDTLNVKLALRSPVYDQGSLSFSATVDEIVALERDKDEPEVPASFDGANLSIAWTVDFQNGLVMGIRARYSGIRGADECEALQQAYDALEEWTAEKFEIAVQLSEVCGIIPSS